ncbi:MAG: hypothetical protein H6753_00775 [Candidatus Omnitrophica bacterium]|nr:hypothetical protein [Candidatus Omnitrophota bacterium]
MTVKINQLIKILLFAAIIAASTVVSVQAYIQDPIEYENRADFICGTTDQHGELRTRHDILITIFNPNDFPVMVNNFLFWDIEESRIVPDLTDRYFSVLVSPKRKFTISCQYIAAMFFPDQLEYQQSQNYFKGSMQSKSMGYLGVAFNYTTSSILNSANSQGRSNEEN